MIPGVGHRDDLISAGDRDRPAQTSFDRGIGAHDGGGESALDRSTLGNPEDSPPSWMPRGF
jgi:hypothetical protein